MINVRDIRIELNLTQDEFGSLFGVCQGTVSQWENGAKTPSWYRRQILVAFKTSIDAGHVRPDTNVMLAECGPIYTMHRILNGAFGVF